jgi:hypothetical protein
MGKTFESIGPELKDWLVRQRIFFVATAPLAPNGHVNCSPKGGDTFRILGERDVAYLDLTGSGIETAAHVQENGRIVIMFCAFEGPPKIVRLHGRSRVIYPDQPEFAELIGLFPDLPGTRAILRVTVSRVSDSCGYSVPYFDFAGPRDTLDKWADAKGPEGLAAYRGQKNRVSIDGIASYRDA